MTKVEVIRNEMVKAMKEQNKERKNALSMLLCSLKNAEIEKREALTDNEAAIIIKKEIKQMRETFDTAPETRQDIKKEASYRIAVYKEFVEEDLSPDQIKEIIKETLDELGICVPKKSDTGKSMKALMPKVKGKADGKLVNAQLTNMMKH